jgi:hypothetical protein
MKKCFLFTVLLAASFSLFSLEVDTLAAWTFPTGVDTLDIYPDVFISNNENYYISAEDTIAWPNTTLRDIVSTAGLTSFAGTVTGWDNGSNAKLWSIKIKAPGYQNLKVSSKQFSEIEFPGPQDWKLQARLSGEDWVDLENGTVVCGTDWTTGVASDIALPEQFNNPGTTSIFIRWIMTSNISTSGSNVEPAGISKIDDVVVTGEIVSGVGNAIQKESFRLYPNPVSDGMLFYTSSVELIQLNIYNTEGQLVSEQEINEAGSIDLSNLTPGVYFAEPVLANGEIGTSEKLIIR